MYLKVMQKGLTLDKCKYCNRQLEEFQPLYGDMASREMFLVQFEEIANSMSYETRRFKAVFTRALQ